VTKAIWDSTVTGPVKFAQITALMNGLLSTLFGLRTYGPVEEEPKNGFHVVIKFVPPLLVTRIINIVSVDVTCSPICTRNRLICKKEKKVCKKYKGLLFPSK